MRRTHTLMALGGSLVFGAATMAGAGTEKSDSEVQSEISALKQRIAELENKQERDWMSERRAEEVKSLIHEVLSDADTRASLLEDGITAGHDGEHFFLSSNDGAFRLNVSGQLQARYVYNNRSGSPATGQDNAGFEMRRAKLGFSGHVADPRLSYNVRLASHSSFNEPDSPNQNGGVNDVVVEKATIGYQLMDGLHVRVGRDKGPFLKEELIHSGRQLAVERSAVNQVFSTGYTEGVYLKYDAHDMVHLAAAITEGANSAGASFDAGTDFGGAPAGGATDFAATARADVKLAGEWGQAKDFAAWSGQPMAVFLGSAVHYEVDETGNGADNTKTIAWTVDGQVKRDGFGLYGAFVGAHNDSDGATGNADNFGSVLQGSYMVVPDEVEPFVRWEWINAGTHLMTVGTNYYLNAHNAKFTFDVLWALDSFPMAAQSHGLLADAPGEEDQVALRAQFQLLF